MWNFLRPVLYLIAIMAIAAAAATGAIAEKIGVAAANVNHVQGVSGGTSRSLAVGSDVIAHEHIVTSDASTAQLLFLDKTSVGIGPRADLVLDSFVYNPNRGAGRVVINAAQGAFRFITGAQNPRDYTIKTPVATIGIRGTMLDGLNYRQCSNWIYAHSYSRRMLCHSDPSGGSAAQSHNPRHCVYCDQ